MPPFNIINCIVILCLLHIPCKAQLPVCSGSGSRLIYIITNGAIYNYDPALPVSITNPTLNNIALPDEACRALAVCNNLNSESPSPTFYTIKDNKYYYYNGEAWVNTDHRAGKTWGIGGGGKFIYSLHNERYIYKYDGKKDETFLLEIPHSGITGDIIGDCMGNFYLFNPRISKKDDWIDSDIFQWLRKYDSSGKFLRSWTISGLPPGFGAGTLGIIGNNVYLQNSTGAWNGIMNDSNIYFTKSPLDELEYRSFASGLDFLDFGTCPIGICPSPDSAISKQLIITLTEIDVDINNLVHLQLNKTMTSLYIKSSINAYTNILDKQGKVVLKNNGTDHIDISSLPNGIYNVEIYDDKGTLLKASRLVKQIEQ